MRQHLIKTYSKQKVFELVFTHFDSAIPFHDVRCAINIMAYGSGKRIAFRWLAETGARPSELDQLEPTNFYGRWCVWKPGKNQTGFRKYEMSISFMRELDYYLMKVRPLEQKDQWNITLGGISALEHTSSKLFTFSSAFLTDYFNKKVRPLLGGNWMRKRLKPRGSLKGKEYIYQIKGLRHNRITFEFWKNLKKWNDPMISLEKTSKEWLHSSYRMTIRHYIHSMEILHLEKYEGMEYPDIINPVDEQKKIQAYNYTGHETYIQVEISKDESQRLLFEY